VTSTSGSTKAETSTKPETGDVKASSRTYVVKAGDNPVRIAKTLGVKLEDLQALNGIDDPKKLKPGQILKVPETVKVERSTRPQTTSLSASTGKAATVSGKKDSGSSQSAKASLAVSKNGSKGTSSANKK
jgi:LysM repeat protein